MLRLQRKRSRTELGGGEMFRLPRGGKDTRVQEIYFWGGFIFQGMLQVLGKRDDSDQKCSACSGHGVSKKGEEITVSVPPGIRDGEAISMPGLGEAVAGGVAGTFT